MQTYHLTKIREIDEIRVIEISMDVDSKRFCVSLFCFTY